MFSPELYVQGEGSTNNTTESAPDLVLTNEYQLFGDGIQYDEYVIDVGDLNGDGKLDLLIGATSENYSIDPIFYLKGRDEGVFDSEHSSVHFLSYSGEGVDPDMGIVDFDMDGDEDIYALNWDKDSIMVFDNNGKGVFNELLSFKFVYTDPEGVSVDLTPFRAAPIDFDKDGDFDFVVTERFPDDHLGAGGWISFNDGQYESGEVQIDRAYLAPGYYESDYRFKDVHVGDFNSDTYDDFIFEGIGQAFSEFYENDSGYGYYWDQIGEPGTRAGSGNISEIFDYGNDGDLDYVSHRIGYGEDSVYVHENMWKPGFHAYFYPKKIATFPDGTLDGESMRVGDLNGDGLDEIVISSGEGGSYMTVFWGDEAHSYQEYSIVESETSGVYSQEMKIVDLDGDGDDEVVSVDSDGKIRVYDQKVEEQNNNTIYFPNIFR